MLTRGQHLAKYHGAKSMVILNIGVFDVGGVEDGHARNTQNSVLLTNGYLATRSKYWIGRVPEEVGEEQSIPRVGTHSRKTGGRRDL